MAHFKIASAGLVSLFLAACGGSSDTSAPAVSRIFDMPLPDDLERSALPIRAQTALSEFERRNAGVIATGGPTGSASGNATFFGNDALALAAEDGAGGYSLIQGDVLLQADTNSGLISGQFQDLSITDGNGATTNLLGQVVRLRTGSIVNGRFGNALSTDGTFNLGGTPASVTGTSQGAFVGDGSEALGVVNGSITVGTDPARGFTGIYTADQL